MRWGGPPETERRRRQRAKNPPKPRQQLRLVRDARGWIQREATCAACGTWFDYEKRRALFCSSACAGKERES